MEAHGRAARPGSGAGLERSVAQPPAGAHPRRPGRVDGAAVARSRAARSRRGARVALDVPAAGRRRSRRARRSRSPSSTRTTTSSSSTSRPASWCIPAAGHETGTLVNALIAHCGDSLSGIGGVKRPGHRAPPRQGHVRPPGRRQERPRASGPRRAVRRSRPHRPAGARLSGARLGRAGPCRRARSRRALARSLHNREKIAVVPERGGPRCAHPLRVDGGPAARRSRWRASCAASWRPAAPTRSACTWPISAIRSWATRSTAPVQDQGQPARRRRSRRRSRRWAGRRCTRPCSGFEHPRTGEILRFESPLPRRHGSAFCERSAGALQASASMPRATSASDVRHRTRSTRVDLPILTLERLCSAKLGRVYMWVRRSADWEAASGLAS